jgi:hypothetical protein
MFGHGGKSSLISESVAETRINIHLAREKLTTRCIECNTLRPFFLYCSSKILEYRAWSLRKLERVCELPEEGLRCLMVRQAWESLRSGESKKPKLRNGLKPVMVQISATLLCGRPCPFIGSRAWFTMHGSQTCLNHIYEQNFSWKALE